MERIEPVGIGQHRGVPALLHVAEDFRDALLDLRVGLGRPVQPRRELLLEGGGGGGQAGRLGVHAVTSLPSAAANASMTRRIASCLSLSAAWLTTSRELMSMMRSTSTRLFALSVPPVDTRSTIASAKPVSGASSMLPYSLIRSTCTPLAAKKSRAMFTYLVATFRRAPCLTA